MTAQASDRDAILDDRPAVTDYAAQPSTRARRDAILDRPRPTRDPSRVDPELDHSPDAILDRTSDHKARESEG